MNKQTYVPIYFQISQEIIQKIKSNEIKSGERIISENEIIKRYKVSNTTARKVLQTIEDQGFAVKIKGKGTFVSDNLSATRSATKVLSFTKNMLQLGIKPGTKLLSCDRIDGPVSTFVNGRNYIINEPVYKIIRLRYANEMPVLKEIRYISSRFCPDISSEKLEGSLYEIYKSNYNLVIESIRQTLTAIIIDDEQLAFFEKTKMIPGFRVDGVTFCGNDLILEIEESVYCGDFYTFSVEATP